MVRGLVMIAVASVITSPCVVRSAAGGRPAAASSGHRHKKSAVRPPPRGLGSWPTTPAGASGPVAVLRISARASSTASVRRVGQDLASGILRRVARHCQADAWVAQAPCVGRPCRCGRILGSDVSLFCSVSTRRGPHALPSCAPTPTRVCTLYEVLWDPCMAGCPWPVPASIARSSSRADGAGQGATPVAPRAACPSMPIVPPPRGMTGSRRGVYGRRQRMRSGVRRHGRRFLWAFPSVFPGTQHTPCACDPRSARAHGSGHRVGKDRSATVFREYKVELNP